MTGKRDFPEQQEEEAAEGDGFVMPDDGDDDAYAIAEEGRRNKRLKLSYEKAEGERTIKGGVGDSVDELEQLITHSDDLYAKALELDARKRYYFAAQYFDKAIELHHVDAMLKLAKYYEIGRGVEKDKQRAVQVYKHALKHGSEEAMFLVAQLLEKMGESERAKEYYEEGADSGCEKCTARLTTLKQIPPTPPTQNVEPMRPPLDRRSPSLSEAVETLIAAGNPVRSGSLMRIKAPSRCKEVRGLNHDLYDVELDCRPAVETMYERVTMSISEEEGEEEEGSSEDEYIPNMENQVKPKLTAKPIVKTESETKPAERFECEKKSSDTIEENDASMIMNETKAHIQQKPKRSAILPNRVRKCRAKKMVGYKKRTSRRLKGLPALKADLDDTSSDADSDGSGAVDKEEAAPRYHKSPCLGKKKQTTHCEVSQLLQTQITLPITLCSISTTIWNMGNIVKGKNEHLYWSSKQCVYHHPYPVGYRATYSAFKNQYEMCIEDSADGTGPIFIVKKTNGTKMESWTGLSPTKPWTGACIASKSPGSRRSGPRLYGFSDPLTMKLIQELPGYVSWEDICKTEESSDGRVVPKRLFIS